MILSLLLLPLLYQVEQHQQVEEEPQQEETSQEDVPIGDVQEKKLRGIEATLSRLESLLSR